MTRWITSASRASRSAERLAPDTYRDYEIKPRVLVEVVTGKGHSQHPNVWIIYCDTEDEAMDYRDQLIAEVMSARDAARCQKVDTLN